MLRLGILVEENGSDNNGPGQSFVPGRLQGRPEAASFMSQFQLVPRKSLHWQRLSPSVILVVPVIMYLRKGKKKAIYQLLGERSENM